MLLRQVVLGLLHQHLIFWSKLSKPMCRTRTLSCSCTDRQNELTTLSHPQVEWQLYLHNSKYLIRSGADVMLCQDRVMVSEDDEARKELAERPVRTATVIKTIPCINPSILSEPLRENHDCVAVSGCCVTPQDNLRSAEAEAVAFGVCAIEERTSSVPAKRSASNTPVVLWRGVSTPPVPQNLFRSPKKESGVAAAEEAAMEEVEEQVQRKPYSNHSTPLSKVNLCWYKRAQEDELDGHSAMLRGSALLCAYRRRFLRHTFDAWRASWSIQSEALLDSKYRLYPSKGKALLGRGTYGKAYRETPTSSPSGLQSVGFSVYGCHLPLCIACTTAVEVADCFALHTAFCVF